MKHSVESNNRKYLSPNMIDKTGKNAGPKLAKILVFPTTIKPFKVILQVYLCCIRSNIKIGYRRVLERIFCLSVIMSSR